MGVDLIGHEEVSLSFANWDGCLALAVAFGWKPAGTAAPNHHNGLWSGTYSSNDFQEVSDQDACLMAAALYRALAARKLTQNRKLTAKQRRAWKAVCNISVCHVADCAAKGGFAIA